MKNHIYLLSGCVLATLFYLSACTKSKKEDTQESFASAPATKSDQYYANLRAYKKTKHQIAFGWISGTDIARPGATNAVEEIPDSMDLVDCWYTAPVSNSYAATLIHKVQKLKGTKFLFKMSGEYFVLNQFAGTKDFDAQYTSKGDAKLQEGFNLVAKTINDSVTAIGLDGVDIDHEPQVCGCNWGPTTSEKGFNMYIKALSKYFGPLSGTGKMMTVNGEYDQLTDPTNQKAVDYCIAQAYNISDPSALQSYYESVSKWLPTSQLIVCPIFETQGIQDHTNDPLAIKGGGDFNDPIRGTVPALIGYAYWNPRQGQKGGVGAYHPEYDKGYKFMRRAIQIMNPAKPR